jgi:hypothetical protein
MNRLFACALLLTTLAVPAPAGMKEPWEWTIDERLVNRFDPQKIREREQAYGAAHPQLQSRRAEPLSANEIRYRIDGHRNPELFLPHELFDYLLHGFNTDPALQLKTRAAYASCLTRAGFDPEQFWPALESISTPYLALRDRKINSRSEAAEQCHARFVALNAARRVFGSDRFDRMLYTAVAPDSQFSEGTTFRDPARRLRREAAGCDEAYD